MMTSIMKITYRVFKKRAHFGFAHFSALEEVEDKGGSIRGGDQLQQGALCKLLPGGRGGEDQSALNPVLYMRVSV